MKTVQASRNSILTLVHSEPEGTKLLLKVAAGGAMALLVWSAMGRAVTNDIGFVLIDLIGIVGYALGMVLLTGNLVRDADRWQVESALQARRLLSTSRKAEPAPAAEPMAATFDHWYLVLRLEDEIKRARRTGAPVSVVIMKIGKPGEDLTTAMSEQIDFDVAQLAANHAKTMSMPSAIGPQEYAFLMANTDRTEAKARVAPLLMPLGDYWCEFGIAVYPDDGADAEGLVNMARDQVEG